MIEKKFCPDCKYWVRFQSLPYPPFCGHSDARQLHGERLPLRHMRASGPCGADGKLFEPKPPVPARKTILQRIRAALRRGGSR